MRPMVFQRFAVTGIAVLMMCLVPSAFAQPWHAKKDGYSKEMKEKFRERMQEHLELTEDQKKVMEKFREQRKEIYKEGALVKAKAERLSDMLKNKTYSDAEIQKAFADASSSFEALNKKRIENMMVLRKSLEQHQLDKLFHFLEKMKQGHWKHKGPHGGGMEFGRNHDGHHGPPPHHKKDSHGFDMNLP